MLPERIATLRGLVETLIETCPLPVAILDHEGKVVAANARVDERAGGRARLEATLAPLMDRVRQGENVIACKVDGRQWQIACVGSRDRGEPLACVAYATDLVGDQPGEELRALAARLQAVREDERAHLASEVHDVLGQALTGIRMDLDWLGRRVSTPGDTAVNERLSAMSELIDTTLQNARRISRALRPGILDDLGLVAAVEWQAREFESRAEIHVHLDMPEEVELDRERATGLFRILQEALTNVARHSQARNVWVSLHAAGNGDDTITLEVRDDGRGIEEGQLQKLRSLGIPLIRERATYLGGSVWFRRPEAGGTSVTVRVPTRGPSA
jgi:signal transduction histidine kinase